MTERKTVRRWWSSVTINRTELWLTEMAKQGWALEDIQENRFVFQKAEPQYREYFLPCLGWRYRGKVAERLSQINIFCNARYGTDPKMKRRFTTRFVEIDVSKVDQNIAPLYQKRYHCKIINTRDVYLHDDIIEQINYDCDTKQLTFLVTKAVMNFTYKICFFDVAGFEASACDYWGGGGFGILDFHLEVENCTLLSKLLSKTKNLPVEYERCRGLRNGKFFEVKFVFFSGDTLRIVAKSIWIEDVLIDETTGWEFS